MIATGTALLAGSAWLLLRGIAIVHHYRIEIRKIALFIEVPPAAARAIPWETIRAMRIEGTEYDIGTGVKTHDEWKTMHLRHAELHLSFYVPR